MIQRLDGGYTLRCTGCTATVSLGQAEVSDPFLLIHREETMGAVHVLCDSYGDVEKAKAAIKAARRAFLRKEAGLGRFSVGVCR